MNRGIDPGFPNEKIVVNNRDMILRKLDIFPTVSAVATGLDTGGCIPNYIPVISKNLVHGGSAGSTCLNIRRT